MYEEMLSNLLNANEVACSMKSITGLSIIATIFSLFLAPADPSYAFGRACMKYLRTQVPAFRQKAVILGFFNPTNQNSQGMREIGDTADLDHFTTWVNATYKVSGYTYGDWEKIGVNGYGSVVPPIVAAQEALANITDQYPGETSIFVNLNHFSAEHAFGNGSPPQKGITNFEIHLILSNPTYFRATKWFIQNRELTNTEVIELFKAWYPKINY